MNLLIAAVVVGGLLYFIGTTIVPIFNPETNVQAHAQSLLLDAQADLGHSKSAVLSLRSGQGLFARNLDSTTRTVATACATVDCCPNIQGCTAPLSADGLRVLANANVKTTLSARCVPSESIHVCKIYVGDAPAQVEIEQIKAPPSAQLPEDSLLSIRVQVRNSGETFAENVRVHAELVDKTADSGTETIVEETETTLDRLAMDESQTAELRIPLAFPGNFILRITADAADAGSVSEERPLAVQGTPASLCARDLSQAPVTTFDSFENVCRTKLFCTGCTFTYECRGTWAKESPVTDPAFYDETRGEPGFAYLLTPSSDGTC